MDPQTQPNENTPPAQFDDNTSRALAQRIKDYKFTDAEQRAVRSAGVTIVSCGVAGLVGGVYVRREVVRRRPDLTGPMRLAVHAGIMGTTIYAGLAVGTLLALYSLRNPFKDSELIVMGNELIKAERARSMQQAPTRSILSNPPISRSQAPTWPSSPNDPSARSQSGLEGLDGATSTDFPRSTEDFGRGASDVGLRGGDVEGTESVRLARIRTNKYGDVVEE
ncbi:hypothetical protein M427DRAFT_55210 [Gonapodya prolifera JEL478]|uniref:Uncharacterized protein n=1 Tax=Gonapodya prolifera (strain JEL478) TaxID=1344416 RepID=A0A139AKD3_GONPJ|nr:hypothetical protein M427DRAFT_55210 [Gonapodya prolifera JEL478]|eukprot:KXS16885.1 hypothetical protein M427DRAFT_55210 [Gonapodya prolifera JEL478]